MMQDSVDHSLDNTSGVLLDEMREAISAGPGSGGDFEDLPYISLPIAYSEPGRLAALAKLHGLEPPNVAAARVLELGCASGGNIIPLAARFPEGRFLGVDLSERHVSDAHSRIESLGLANIEIRQGDLSELALDPQSFDFIICHGVFSWVPPGIQDAILRLCRRALTPQGIAAVSYNVLPGWHLRSIMRDMCLRHARPQGTPRERVADARAIIAAVAEGNSSATPYGHVVVEEAKRLARQPSSYILGEFLAPFNAPCTFREFVSRARQHGLAFVSEGDLASSIPSMLVPEAAKKIAALAGPDPIVRQEYCDLFSGRTFRRTLLARADEAALRREPTPNTSLSGLYVAAPLKVDRARSTPESTVFLDHRGGSLICTDAAVREALIAIGRRYPSSVAVDELVATCAAATSEAGSQARLNRAIMRIVAEGRATVSAAALDPGGADVPYPEAWPVARAEAAAGQPWVTSLKHTAVRSSEDLRLLIGLMNGRRTRDELVAELTVALKERPLGTGQREMISGAARQSEPIPPELVASRLLAYAEENALLMPANS